ncbi:putative uncharacterized protein DDB_G0286901 isoform X3 [Culicoides brevitarsis]|uniref:putative uncharacterized protein DDB_G0286901 isoform X3 n=1 Tax=Culicoides brevitarsis TaxID=469753 RepID=UPI00307C3FC6
MSDSSQHDDQVECPLCMEPLDVDDLSFYPCSCGYQICRFCWHRIRTDENELCPACRKAYSENPADFTPLSQEQIVALKAEKRQKDQQKKQKINEDRKHLANVRVVQKNLVFVVGLPPRLADPEVLKRHEYFGKYGKIHKVVINPSTAYAGAQGPSASAYVTYVNNNDSLRAIQSVNNITIDGRLIKTSLGTTKYCSNFMKNQPCPKPDCMYLHELGDEEASFTKEEMHQGKHQEYEKKLHDTLIALTQNEELKSSAEKSERNEKNEKSEKSEKNEKSNGSGKENSNGNSNSSSNSSSAETKVKKPAQGKRNKETWPSLSNSPTPKSAGKQVNSKENGKNDSKCNKSEKTKAEKNKTSFEEENISQEGTWNTASQEDNHAKEIAIDKANMDESERKDEEAYFNEKANTDFTNGEHKQEDPALIETENKTTNRPINSQLPDLLSGTEIDRHYFNLAGDKALGPQNKTESLPDWEDSLKYLMMRTNAEDNAKQQFRKTDELFAFNNLTLNDLLMDNRNALFPDQYHHRDETKQSNCSSNMLKFFDFHKNLQNQQQNYQKTNTNPVEKPYSMMNECLNKPEGGSPRQTSSFQQQDTQFGVNNKSNSSKNNLLNSMYHMQNASVADELGFDPFAETQKALAELMRDEVTRKKMDEQDMAKRQNTIHAPPGFNSVNACKLNSWTNNAYPQLGQNAFNANKSPSMSNYQDWTSLDPAIVSFRQFPTYGQMPENLEPRQQPQPNPQPMSDYLQYSQLGGNSNFGMDPSQYGLNGIRNLQTQMTQNPFNWFSHNQNNYQQNSVSFPPGFQANLNGNKMG